jgi:hypothetical protein
VRSKPTIPSVREGENGPCLSPSGHCDRQVCGKENKIKCTLLKGLTFLFAQFSVQLKPTRTDIDSYIFWAQDLKDIKCFTSSKSRVPEAIQWFAKYDGL